MEEGGTFKILDVIRMAIENTMRKKLLEYLDAKGYPKNSIRSGYKIPYLEMGNPNACLLLDVAVLGDDGMVKEFYEIKSNSISSSDVKKHNSKFEEIRHRGETEAMIANGALGFLVTYDKKKKDIELFLITDEIDSLSTYVEVVQRLTKTKPGYSHFFRGQGSVDFSLLPSLYRRPNTPPKERDLLKEAIRRCPEEFSGLNSTFQQLVKLQHYGIPTRLLDLTSNALIALFFAVEKKEYKQLKTKKIPRDGVVFDFTVDNKYIKSYDSDTVSVLSNLARVESFTMPEMPCDEKAFNKETDTVYLLHEIRYEKPHFLPVICPSDLKKTFCVKPKLDNARIRQQSGAFFLYGIGKDKNTCSPLMEHPINIIISHKFKDKLKAELACFGITDAYVYPEMVHVMRDIKDEYKV